MAPLVVTGSWAEKMTFEAFLVFVGLWPLLVYYPMVHWVWSPHGWLASMGVTDFAGGIVIHANVGVAGLVVSYLLQRRKLHSQALAHHNLPLSFAGAALVWSGWYSFNGGSALKANSQAAGALLNTHLSACAGGLIWSLWNYRDTQMWSMMECLNGAFAGLGGITAASGFVEPWAAMVIGLLTSTASFFSVKLFRDRLHLDDVLGVASLQGTSGIVGSLLVGLFCTESMVPDEDGHENGLFYGGGWHLLWAQCLGAAVVILWSGTWSYAILILMKHTVGIDISYDVEAKGLDIAQMGEQAYDQKLDLLDDIGGEAVISLLNAACANDDLEDVQALIEVQGANPHWADFEGRQPVHVAAAAGSIEVLDYLCNHHQVDLNAVDKSGRRPLWHACQSHQHETIVWIRENGGEMDRSFIETEIFDIAATGDQVEDLRTFVEAGVDFNFWDYDKRTPLMIAAHNGHEEIVSMLLKAGAEKDLVDRWGRTAIDSAKLARQTDCVKLLSYRGELPCLDEVLVHEGTLLINSGSDSDLSSRGSDHGHAVDIEVKKELLYDYSSDLSTAVSTMSSSSRKSIRSFIHSKNEIVNIANTAEYLSRSMCAAASEGDLDEIKRLIVKGGDPKYVLTYSYV
jgi:ammonium transporter, Amt family